MNRPVNRLLFLVGVVVGVALSRLLPYAASRLVWTLAAGCWPDEGES